MPEPSAVQLEPGEIGSLLDLLQEGPLDRRIGALRACHAMPLSDASLREVGLAALHLLEETAGADPLARHAAIRAAAHLPVLEVRAAVRALLDAEADAAAAAEGLAEVGDVTGAVTLFTVASDRTADRLVRDRAAELLARLDGTGLPVEDLARAADEEPDVDIRFWLAMTAARHGDLDPMRRLLADDPDEEEGWLLGPDPLLAQDRLTLASPPADVRDLVLALADANERGSFLAQFFVGADDSSPEGTPARPVSREQQADARAQAQVLLADAQPYDIDQRVWNQLDVLCDLAPADAGGLIDEVLVRVDVEAELLNGTVQLVQALGAGPLVPIPRLFHAYSRFVPVNDGAARQVAWVASRADPHELVEQVGPALRTATSADTAVAFLEVAGRSAHEPWAPVLGGGHELAEAPSDRPLVSLKPEQAAPLREPANLPPRAAPALGPTQQDVRTVNAWLDDDDAVQVDVTATLHLNVGDERPGGLAPSGDPTIAVADIPEAGLETTWLLSTTMVELAAAGDPDVEVATTELNGTACWLGRFELLVPQTGESATRSLLITPRTAEGAQLDVTILVRGEPYRTLTISLDVETAARGAMTVEVDTTHSLLDETGLWPPHEWQTPWERLTLTFAPPMLSLQGSVDGRAVVDVSTSRPVAAFAGRISTVREEADRFRAAHQGHLDAITPDDLEAHLAGWQPNYDWGAPPPSTPALAHQQAWESVARSEEARRLATAGHHLFTALFPADGPAHEAIRTLHPGSRLDFVWLPEASGTWAAHVPWQLMYVDAPPARGEPVDAESFLGLRHRLAYVAHRIPGGSKVLGTVDATTRAHLVYWGEQPGDPTVDEAQRQRDPVWAGVPALVVPGDTANRRDALLDFLDHPAPGPVPVVYVFCQARGSTGANGLRFGSTNAAEDVLDLLDLTSTPLPDRPLMFLNACGTAESDPLLASELMLHFFERGCRAVIGTECRVPIVLASRLATVFLRFLYRQMDPDPISAGEALMQTRRFLWEHFRNPGGLFYSYVNQYELFLADQVELRAPPH